MTATLWSTSNPSLLSQPSEASTARLSVVPWSKFGTHRLYVDTTDGRQVGWIDLKTGHRTIVLPELAPAFELALAEAEDWAAEATDSPTPRRALDDAIEHALIAGHAARLAQTSLDPTDHQAEEPTELMRHAYRGKQAYSAWDLGASGKRLLEEPGQEVTPDPHWTYLNSCPSATRVR